MFPLLKNKLKWKVLWESGPVWDWRWRKRCTDDEGLKDSVPLGGTK